MLQAILPEKHMIDDRAHAHCGRAVNNYFVRSIVRGRIRFTGARNNCVIGYKGLMEVTVGKHGIDISPPGSRHLCFLILGIALYFCSKWQVSIPCFTAVSFKTCPTFF